MLRVVENDLRSKDLKKGRGTCVVCKGQSPRSVNDKEEEKGLNTCQPGKNNIPGVESIG